MIPWLLALALAGEEPETPPPGPDAAIEVIVFEEMLVEKAKQQVYTDLQEAGYTEMVRKDDKAIFRHPEPYKGEVHVYDDGWMRVKRQKIQVEGREMPWAEKNSPLAWAGCILWSPLCIRPAGQTVGSKKFRSAEDRVVRWAQGDVNAWGDRIADLSVKRKTDVLPNQLEALWAEGTPIEREGESLATPAERRHELMRYWASRTDTPWGEQVRASVEAFCRGVVQHSEHPFTQAEIDQFNATLPEHVRRFDLSPRVSADDPLTVGG